MEPSTPQADCIYFSNFLVIRVKYLKGIKQLRLIKRKLNSSNFQTTIAKGKKTRTYHLINIHFHSCALSTDVPGAEPLFSEYMNSKTAIRRKRRRFTSMM